MSEQTIMKFKVIELKGAMDYNVAHIILQPTELYVNLQVEGIEENGVVTVSPTELNKLVQDIRGIALAEMPKEMDY